MLRTNNLSVNMYWIELDLKKKWSKIKNLSSLVGFIVFQNVFQFVPCIIVFNKYFYNIIYVKNIYLLITLLNYLKLKINDLGK